MRTLTAQEIDRFRKRVYDYYLKYGRDLPWRKTGDPYKILISEVMLQQTQVPRVIEKYSEFLNVFPDIRALASAPLSEVLGVWQGLGYNRRALSLQKLAEVVVDQYDGMIPSTVEELMELPGVGPATAHAVCTFAHNQPAVFIETNIRTVFIHHFFKERDDVRDSEIRELVAQTLVRENPREWYYALMDYGVALKREHANPGRRSAHYQRQGPFKGSNRQIRGMILRALIERTRLTESQLMQQLDIAKESVKRNLHQLTRDGLVVKQGEYYSIA
jgi:A/G-specific adenine glycosylase